MASLELSLLITHRTPHVVEEVLIAVQAERQLPAYHGRTEAELLDRFQDVCQNLARWLEAGDDAVLRERYGSLARERIQERVPLSEIVLAAQTFERVLVEHLRTLSHEENAQFEEDFEATIREFFNQVILNVVVAYEQAVLRALL
jgi:hypothetical protein